MTGSKDMEKLRKAIDLIIGSFNVDKASTFELGQLDGLRWALDVIDELEKVEDEQ